MVIALFSRENVSISDIDALGHSDLVYWYDCHMRIIAAIKEEQRKKASKSAKKR